MEPFLECQQCHAAGCLALPGAVCVTETVRLLSHWRDEAVIMAIAIMHSLPAWVRLAHGVCSCADDTQCLGNFSTLPHEILYQGVKMVPGCALCLELLQSCNLAQTLALVAAWGSYQGI